MTVEESIQLARQHHQAGRIADAQSVCRGILEKFPNEPNALNLLAGLACETANFPQAIDLLTRAIAIDPAAAQLHFNLAVALAGMQRFSEAADACLKAAQLAPKNVAAWNNAGALLRRAGKLEESLLCQQKAVEHNPDSPECHSGLGLSLNLLGRLEEATAALQKSLQLNPRDYRILNNLGLVLCERGLLDSAAAAFNEVIKIRPADAGPQINLAIALFRNGNWPSAIAAYKKAADLSPGSAPIQSNYLYAMQFQPDYDAKALLDENRQWNQHFAQPLAASIKRHENDRAPDRRLRIGYVSPNFREHSQAPFILPLLQSHDRRQFEIFCYSDAVKTDPTTQKMKQCADIWRDTLGQPDDSLAQTIRADRIDILVDLTMHMAGSRLLVFAQKPAPVQVTWLAYPGTTGLTAIDYRLTDALVDPPGTDENYVEKSLRLPHTFAAFDPAALQAPWPPLIAPPSEKNGYITFGSLNNFCKINQPLLNLWAAALKAVPSSRLLMLAPPGSARERTLAVFTKFGIETTRIDFVPGQSRTAYLKELNRIDICLDTLPYNGHTTTLDAIYMGVPVVWRVGNTAPGRVCQSLAHNLGLTDLVAHSDDEFPKIAASLAAGAPRLSHLRSTLREKLLASPINDAPAFARDVETAFRQIWQTWCQ